MRAGGRLKSTRVSDPASRIGSGVIYFVAAAASTASTSASRYLSRRRVRRTGCKSFRLAMVCGQQCHRCATSLRDSRVVAPLWEGGGRAVVRRTGLDVLLGLPVSVRFSVLPFMSAITAQQALAMCDTNCPPLNWVARYANCPTKWHPQKNSDCSRHRR
jgi:hypothetical protein